MNILLLFAGQEQSEGDDGYPLCLKEFGSKTLLQRLVETCQPLKPNRLVMAFPRDDLRAYHLDDIVQLVAPGSSIVEVPAPTQGALCTALLAIEAIATEAELLIVNGNELLDADYKEVVVKFRASGYSAGTVVFPSIHPRYSYVRIDAQGLVEEAAEKRPISKNATAGFYWFKRGKDFVESAMNMIRKDTHVAGRYYICPVLNEFVLLGLPVGVFQVPSEAYHPLKNLRQQDHFQQAHDRD